MSPFGFTPTPRETIYQTFFDLVSGAEDSQGAPAFKTLSRKLTGWAQVASEEKPGLYQIQIDEDLKNELGSGIPYVDKASVELYIFVSQEDSELATSTLLNPLVDSVFAAMQPSDADEKQTLGGLIDDVRIGKVMYREGLMGPNAFAVIPVEMLIAGLQPDGSED